MIETHRGIRTTTKRINEKEPKTITNRLGQLSVSLPRIDDEKRFAGYPGVAGTARPISKIIPADTECYIEPFAGTAKVYQEYYKINKKCLFMLNDTSKFLNKWLNRNFGSRQDTLITRMDFSDYFDIQLDRKHFVFFIDHPWFKTFYDQSFSSFTLKSVKEYDEAIIKSCKKLSKASFFITTRKENTRMLNSGFYCYLVKSEYVVMNRYPKVLLTTNVKIDLRKHKLERIR